MKSGHKKIDFNGINQALLNNLKSYCQQWLPSGKQSGAEYSSVNPTRGDSHAGSFSINTHTGVWADFATGDAGSDPISLYAYLFTSNDQGQAAKALADLLGMDNLPVGPTGKNTKPRTDWVPCVAPDNAPLHHKAHIKRGFPEMVWEYKTLDGKTAGFMYRFKTSDGGKEVLPLTWCKNTVTEKEEWRWMGFSVPRYLFGLQYLTEKPDATVLLVEGEKCAAAAALECPQYACLTWPGGTKAVDKIDWAPLAGRKVIIWPDCDGAVDKGGILLPDHLQGGYAAAYKISQILLLQGCDVSIIDIPAPGKKKHGWDIADAIEEGLTGQLLADWIVNQCPAAASPSSLENKSDVFEPIASVGHLLARYALVYAHGGTVFDYEKRVMLKQSDMVDACISREYAKQWQGSAHRKIVSIENVGFDPGGKDPVVTCNLWNGWPTTPKKGDCSKLLQLMRFMCHSETEQIREELYQWLLRWLAYPIQHPGAKLKTAVVIHGPQGTGKSQLMECVMEIYGGYGRIIGQDAIEDRFNDWASKKLFLIADEVVARSDLYHVKNKLKSFITGDYIRINPKNLMAYEERNHVNMVFLSNERMPVVLEEDDRRHAVIWTPDKAPEDFYIEIAREKEQGGVAALHDYLLHLDLAGFNEHTKPPMTEAKRDLIDLSKDTINRFYEEWEAGYIDGFKPMPVLSEDFYDLYKVWCGKQGVKPGSLLKLVDMCTKRLYCKKRRCRFVSTANEGFNPRMFIFPDEHSELPEGKSESGWLGCCVSEFRENLSSYRGRNHD